MNKQNTPTKPDENKIEELLAKIQPAPGEGFHQKMEQAAWRVEKEERQSGIRNNQWTKITVAMTALLVLALLLISPQGRAFAQRIVLFFTVTEEESFPIPTEQVYSLPATETPVPTFILPVQPVATAAEPAKVLEPDLSCTSAASKSGYFCQIKAVEAEAGFDAKELPLDPKGMKFSKAAFDTTTQTINMEFAVSTGGGSLYFSQGLGEFPSASKWGEVPVDRIEQVTVNGQYAELVLGTFVVYPNATEAVWEPGGLLRLHWRADDRWFSLEKMGDPYPIEWLGKNEIVELAESLVDERPLNVNQPVDPENLTSVAAAEELAGFGIPEPTYLPQGYEFKRAVWGDNVVRLFYGPQTSPEISMLIFMWQDPEYGHPCPDCPPGTVEDVQIGLWRGWYWRGAFNMGLGAAVQPTPTPVWEADARAWHLIWNTDTLGFSMFYTAPDDYGGEMNKETMVKIAESMK